MSIMKISIVIPVFNRAAFLVEALKSIQQQTDNDYEVVIVDDGSTDNTAAVVAPFLSSGQFTYFYQRNQERGAARNAGICRSTGEYVYFLDSDDQLLPNHIFFLKKVILQLGHPDLVAAQSSFSAPDSTFLASPSPLPLHYYSCTDLLDGNRFSCNFAIRRASIRSPFPAHRSFVTMEDWMFLLLNTYPDRSIAYLSYPTVVMRNHPFRSMHNHSQVIKARLAATDLLLSALSLGRKEQQILRGHSLLFIAVHQRLNRQPLQSLRTISMILGQRLTPAGLLRASKLLIRCFIDIPASFFPPSSFCR